jgi:probable HAF family extracellular repeat protein
VTGSGVSAFVQGAPQGAFLTQPNALVNWSPRPAAPPVNPTLFMDQIVNGTYDNVPWNPNVDQTLRPAPTAVNNHGVTTGRGASYPHGMTFLGTTAQTTAIGPTGEVCVGYAINDANEVVGVKAVQSWTHAVRIAGGVTTDLGSFRTQPANGSNEIAAAYDINQFGVIVGEAANDNFVGPGNEMHAFRWTEGTGLQDLGTLGGPFSSAYDIRDDGTVVGRATDASHALRAVVWSPSNAITVIPHAPPVSASQARWISDAEWVVGNAHIHPTGPGWFLYHEGQTYDLMSLIDDDGTHWSDLVITDMNNSGQMVGYGMNDVSGSGARQVFVLDPNSITATALALIDAEATSERVRLRWLGPSHSLLAAVQRRGENEDWSYLADVASDGTGLIAYEDFAVQPGQRYGYRLEIVGSDPREYVGEAWVNVPAREAFAIRGFAPNPSPASPTVAFALPTPGPARLDVLDVMGRRVASREWVSLEAGAHTIPLGAEVRLPPGVYVVRLTFAAETITANGIVLER